MKKETLSLCQNRTAVLYCVTRRLPLIFDLPTNTDTARNVIHETDWYRTPSPISMHISEPTLVPVQDRGRSSPLIGVAVAISGFQILEILRFITPKVLICPIRHVMFTLFCLDRKTRLIFEHMHSAEMLSTSLDACKTSP